MADRILTIGHSSHPIDVFLRLLRQHGVEAVADTRSYPQSKFAPQYDSVALRAFLRENGIEYIFLGKELGGRPDGAQFYDADGRVLYSRVAESALFQRGLERLSAEMGKFKFALLCSEENPSICHRRLLIARVLDQRGIAIDHIRRDGSVQSEEELLNAESASSVDAQQQLVLFERAKASEWKSIPSVLPRKRQNSSSTS
jgi:uncharacterized protein (DUF488 family)